MSPRDRVHLTLNHQQPDLCPWYVEFTQGALARLVEYSGDPAIADHTGSHLARLKPLAADAFVEVKPGHFRDQFGVVWNRTLDPDIGTPEGLIFPEPRLGDYRWPDPDDPARWKNFARQLEAAGDKFILISVSYALFERAWSMRGMENLLVDMYEHPAFVDDLLDAILEFQLGIVRAGCRLPIDAVYCGDDYGQQQGMLISPHLWRRFFKSRLARLYQAAHDAGKWVFIHSCGNLLEILPDLIEIGVDCFNPFQPEVMDVYQVKREYGARLAFFGGVSTQRLLPYGTPEQVKAEVRRLIREVGKNGGYILAPAHAVPRDARPENLVALMEAVRGQ
jgi:uroporphyrinogen decarboxylase